MPATTGHIYGMPSKQPRRLVNSAASKAGFGCPNRYAMVGTSHGTLIVVKLSGDRITAVNSFLDTGTLFPRFDWRMKLSAWILKLLGESHLFFNRHR